MIEFVELCGPIKNNDITQVIYAFQLWHFKIKKTIFILLRDLAPHRHLPPGTNCAFGPPPLSAALPAIVSESVSFPQIIPSLQKRRWLNEPLNPKTPKEAAEVLNDKKCHRYGDIFWDQLQNRTT